MAVALLYEDGEARELMLTVHAAVYAAAVAARSALGAVPAGGRCDNATHLVSAAAATVALGSAHVLPVSLCDFERLAVDHELPRNSLAEVEDGRALTAAYRRAGPNASSMQPFATAAHPHFVASNASAGGAAAADGAPAVVAWAAAEVTYEGGARYAVRVAPPSLGEYEVLVWLGGELIGQAPHMYPTPRGLPPHCASPRRLGGRPSPPPMMPCVFALLVQARRCC